MRLNLHLTSTNPKIRMKISVEYMVVIQSSAITELYVIAKGIFLLMGTLEFGFFPG